MNSPVWMPSGTNFNPRTPRGVRQKRFDTLSHVPGISIHAPREGCDPLPFRLATLRPDFNPRTPRGVRRSGILLPLFIIIISIHAPREGCDRWQRGFWGHWRHFNPRTPRGVRLFSSKLPPFSQEFQSTHPARGATWHLRQDGGQHLEISIHAPREGCDTTPGVQIMAQGDFNPRTPRGVRQSWPDKPLV